MEPMTFALLFQATLPKYLIAMHAVMQGFALYLTACTAKKIIIRKQLMILTS